MGVCACVFVFVRVICVCLRARRVSARVTCAYIRVCVFAYEHVHPCMCAYNRYAQVRPHDLFQGGSTHIGA